MYYQCITLHKYDLLYFFHKYTFQGITTVYVCVYIILYAYLNGTTNEQPWPVCILLYASRYA
jgi:hypothetical protein